MKFLGNFKTTAVDILYKDIDLWGVDENNKEDQLTILVSDDSLFDKFLNHESVWSVVNYNGEHGQYVLVELLGGVPTEEVIVIQ